MCNTRIRSLQILFPLHGEQIFFSAVALLASRDKIPPGTLPRPDNRNDMIHCQLFRRKIPAAIVTETFGNTITPPTTLSKLASLALFLPDLLFGYFSDKIIQYYPLSRLSISLIAALARSSHLSFSECPE